MIGATVLVFFVFAFIALTRKQSGAALGVVIISMMIWPEFLRIPLGLVQMSVPRLIALLLLIKFISKGHHRRINYGKADTLVILIWLWTIIGSIIAGAEFSQITQMIGRGLDTVLMYFVARMALMEKADVKSLYWGIGLVALTMCFAGVYEAITWSSPYHRFSGGGARINGWEEIRYGMLRAQGSTLVSIYFGMAMMVMTGLLWSIRGYVDKQFTFKIIIFSAVLATFSSLSSGPWIALFTLIATNLYYKRPTLIKPSLYFVLFIALMLELVSNRHFYNLIDYIALNSSTAWYRTRLLEIAVSQWQDYWLFGVGSSWPHHWAAMLDGRRYIDIVNNFVVIALYGGLPALFMYIAVHVIAIKSSIQSFKHEHDIPRKKLLFGLSAALVALDLSSMSVGLYGPALLLSYMLLGFIISVSKTWDKNKIETDNEKPLA